MVSIPIRILLVEDSERDAVAVERELVSGGYTPDCSRVETIQQLREMLGQAWDGIIADEGVAGFTCIEALPLVRTYRPDLPFIVVSEAVDEERAIKAIKAGASDVVSKENFARLVPAVRRALQEAEEWRARHEAEHVRAYLSQILISSDDAIIGTTLDGIITSWNLGAERLYGYTASEAISQPVALTIPRDRREELAATLARIRAGERTGHFESVRVRKDGRHIPVSISVSPVFDDHGLPIGASTIAHDITAYKRAKEQSRFYAQILDAVRQAVVASTLEGTITYWNHGAEMLFGWEADEVTGQNLITVLPTLGIEEQAHSAMAPFSDEDRQLSEWVVQRRDGTPIPVRTYTALIRDADGALRGRISVSTDLSEQKRGDQALRETEERYRMLVDLLPDGVVVVRDRHEVEVANRTAARLFGVATPRDLIGLDVNVLISPDEQAHGTSIVDEHARGDGPPDEYVEYQLRRLDGTTFPAEIASAPLPTGGATRLHLAVVRDVTERKAHEAELQHLALHDALTGLPNRSLLFDRLNHDIATAQRRGTGLALLLMDLDHFKEINDSYGHQFGDHVLQVVAHRLAASLREPSTIARLGGDEFAVVLPDVDLLGALQMTTELTATLEESVDLSNQRIHVGASIGIALFPDHGDTAGHLLQRADVAMYAAKGTNTGYAIYAPEWDSYSPVRLVLVNELQEAIETDQLLVHFQPKLHLATGFIEGVEALVRWQHPTHGTIPPDQFIPIAEHSGLIRPLTTWVVRKALEQCARWQSMGFDLGVAVNFSSRSLHDPDLPCVLERLLRESGVPPQRFTVEITESVLMAEPERAMGVLTRLKDLGIRISIDDFGTGYSSLTYLRQLHVDELKIDKSFVKDLDAWGDDAVIVRAVMEMGHNLGLDVVAEGVETQSALDVLGAYQCEWAQGYYIGRPHAGGDLTAWLQAQPHARRLGHRIVVVEDDAELRELLNAVLSHEGFAIISLEGGERMDELSGQSEPSLFLIDMMLRGTTGIELAEELRRGRFGQTPMLAMSGSDLMRRAARESGLFQSVLGKPFELDELVEAVQSLVHHRVG